MLKTKAIVHGAISIVNAIPTGKGATMGISLRTEAVVQARRGTGIHLVSGADNTNLIQSTVRMSVPPEMLSEYEISISVRSEIPMGYGLKSSSSISTAVALASAKLFDSGQLDRLVLQASVDASIESGVSITGAYDDACGCYYGGIVVTDNIKCKTLLRKPVEEDLTAVIFIPANKRRKNPRRLRDKRDAFNSAWNLAMSSRYWDAMTVNGITAAPILGTDPTLISKLISAGALGASVSGNGPAVAAVARTDSIMAIREVFDKMDGRIITSAANNKKASVRVLQD